MPQIMIDTAAESAESLRLLSVLLISYAGFKDAQDASDRAAGLSVGQTAQAAVAAAVGLPEAHAPEPKANPFKPVVVPPGTNILPFPGAPTLPAVTAVVTPVVLPPVSDMPVVARSVADAPAGANAITQAVELDKADIPWDERIHQSNRNKKTDGTWMLKRGLDKALAASVLAELTAAKLAKLPPVAPAAGPVSLPPVGLSLPTPVVAQLPPAPVGAALPGLPAVPATLSPVQRFSAMMVKINAAKASGQIDQNMIDEAHKAMDLPQLQLCITQPDKIPLIEAALGL